VGSLTDKRLGVGVTVGVFVGLTVGVEVTAGAGVQVGDGVLVGAIFVGVAGEVGDGTGVCDGKSFVTVTLAIEKVGVSSSSWNAC
jgi:hypothetical protein